MRAVVSPRPLAQGDALGWHSRRRRGNASSICAPTAVKGPPRRAALVLPKHRVFSVAAPWGSQQATFPSLVP